MPTSLNHQFGLLAEQLEQLISLLEESNDKFWIAYMRRGLRQVQGHNLAGATFILGCYGGQDTFSDVTIASQWETTEPLRFRNANARLQVLRDNIFNSADAIASRRHW